MPKNAKANSHALDSPTLQLAAGTCPPSAKAPSPAQGGGTSGPNTARVRHLDSEPASTSEGEHKRSSGRLGPSEGNAVAPKEPKAHPATSKAPRRRSGPKSTPNHEQETTGKDSPVVASAVQVQQDSATPGPKVLTFPRPPSLPPPKPPSIRKYSPAELQQGLKRGMLFRAVIRYNASDSSQAFATLPVLPSDILIKVGPSRVGVHGLHALGGIRKVLQGSCVGQRIVRH